MSCTAREKREREREREREGREPSGGREGCREGKREDIIKLAVKLVLEHGSEPVGKRKLFNYDPIGSARLDLVNRFFFCARELHNAR